jgi:nucleoside-diphosphate-sugar epimerase
MVLGTGWLGSAVVQGLGDAENVVVLDPVLVPELMAFDRAASATMANLLADTGTTAVINVCGLTAGGVDDLEAANVGFPRWLCDVLLDTGARLVHVGSAAEYGDPATAMPIPESTPCRPIGHYGNSKARGTEVVLAARNRGLDATAARVFNLVDRPLPASSPVQQWLDALDLLGDSGGEVEVWWPATQRDFITRQDAARALVDLSGRERSPALVNVCSGIGLAYGEIVRALALRMGIDAAVRSLDRPGIEAVVGDPATLRDVVGWVPEMSMEVLVETVIPTTTQSGSRN